MRGLIVDIKDDRAIVLKDDGTFANIKNKNYKVGQSVKESRSMFAFSLKIAACIAICLMISTAAYAFYYTPYSYLYIDINPSVRLDLNYFDVVIGCTPLNADAEFIEVSSGDVEKSINEVIEKCEQGGFLTEENNEIEINVSNDNDKVRDSVNNIQNKYKSTKYNVVVKDTTHKEVQKANEQGISVKRQRSIEEFSTVFGGDEKENAEKLKDKTTKEIDAIISREQTPVIAEPKPEENEEAPAITENEQPKEEKPVTKPKPRQESNKVKSEEEKPTAPAIKEEPRKNVEAGKPSVDMPIPTPEDKPAHEMPEPDDGDKEEPAKGEGDEPPAPNREETPPPSEGENAPPSEGETPPPNREENPPPSGGETPPKPENNNEQGEGAGESPKDSPSLERPAPSDPKDSGTKPSDGSARPSKPATLGGNNPPPAPEPK